jgi:TolB-like protein
VKPGNLVLDRHGVIKVVDFGIARVVTEGNGLTNAATLLGTPGYMAPEQAQGKPVDGRADVYSLGVTLFELLSGEPPYPGSDPISIVVKSLEEPLPDLRRRGVADELVALVEKMTAKDPAARMPSMEAARTAMREAQRKPRFAAGSLPGPVSGVSPTEVALPSTVLTQARPRQTPWLPLLLIPAAISGAVVWWSLRTPSEPRPTSVTVSVPAVAPAPVAAPVAVAPRSGPLRVAILKFKNLSGDAALDMLERGIGETAVTTLAGQIPKITLLERNDLESNITEIDRAGDLHFDPATVARLGKLEGLEYAVLGGIQASGGQIRITARIVRVENGEVLHSISHTATGSVFDAQDEVARLIEAKLRLLAEKEGR